MISITPFNFFTLLFLKILNNKTFGYVYLRSDGHKEYYYKYGTVGRAIYSFMFKVVTSTLKIISVSKNLTGLKKNYSLVNPSEIDKKWIVNRVKPNLYKPKLLYLGRYKKEKGVFSIINIINSLSTDLQLNIVGTKQKILSTNKKIKFFKELSSIRSIISCYDKCNIFVLPSYTEGSPKVILESLARHRPVIVFEDIKHVKKNFTGVFVCKRNTEDFLSNVNFILKNYSQINKKIKQDKIFTKKDFQKQLSKITL
jgi:glycosyltransferase involved in cell wall biosynthesis